MHGGAPGSGAPKGNKNALKDGFYTPEGRDQRKRLRELLREARRLLRDFAGG